MSDNTGIEKLKALIHEHQHTGRPVVYAALTIEDCKDIVEKYKIATSLGNISASVFQS